MNQKGITFIEIIIAILIFGLSLPAIFGGLYLAYDGAKKSSYRTSAIARCQQRIEQMKKMSYGNVTSANLPNDTVTLDNAGTTSTGDDLIGSRVVTITANTNPTFKNITVSVTWKNKYSEQIRSVITP